MNPLERLRGGRPMIADTRVYQSAMSVLVAPDRPAERRECDLEERKSRRAALLARAVARDAPFCLCLCYPGRMADQRSEDGRRRRRAKDVRMHDRNCAWTVWELFDGSTNLRCMIMSTKSFAHIHQAMMKPTFSTARRHGRVVKSPNRGERQDNRETQHGQ